MKRQLFFFALFLGLTAVLWATNSPLQHIRAQETQEQQQSEQQESEEQQSNEQEAGEQEAAQQEAGEQEAAQQETGEQEAGEQEAAQQRQRARRARGQRPQGVPGARGFQGRPGGFAQQGRVGQRRAEPQAVATAQTKTEIPEDWMEHFTWRSIGPANMSGRITSIAVYEKDPCIWWAASASGGLLKTENNGVTFEHQFDDQATVSIGDVQVCQSDPNILWVGTGEANPRNSVSWGDGVYKSTDGGKTWTNKGLKKSFQIGRIAIDPTDPNIVYVGALGRLWGPSEERGLYKTTDGGENWEKILYVDDKTGVIDVQMHPADPTTLLVATYERERDGFDGNDPGKKYGEGAGIYRTTDGGKSFAKITQGLPSCNLGRIGLNYYRKDPNVVYAVIESEKIASEPEGVGFAGWRGEDADVGARLIDVTKDGPADQAGLKLDDIVVSIDGALVHSNADLEAEIRRHKSGDSFKVVASRDRKSVEVELALVDRPQSRRPRGGGNGNRRGNTRNAFTGTLGGQAANLQGQQGGENEEEYGGVYRSDDGGSSWQRINTLNPRPMYYSQVRVDPSDNQYIYILGTSLYRSTDGGQEFNGDGGRGIHPDHHAMWIDPNDGRHMILGNDGGIYVTWNRMDNWDHHNHVAIGQFYHVGIDHNRDYKVYGGLQDNGSWGGPAQTRTGGPTNTDWYRVGGGDGFITLVDPDDADQIYFESQNGAMGRINLRTGERGFIRPRPPSREVRYRWNWKTPFILSPHNSEIHYSAGNHVFRSVKKGDGIKQISPDITNTDRGAGSAISESPVEEGVIYVGTTDGAVWVTKDGGQNWDEIFVKREEPAAEGDAETSESAETEAETKSEPESAAKESAEAEAKKEPKQEPEEQPKDQPKEEPKQEPKEDEPPEEEKAMQSTLVGSWTGQMLFDRLPEDQRGIKLEFSQADDGKVTGTLTTPRSQTTITSVEFDAETGEFTLEGKSDVREVVLTGTLKGDELKGTIDMGRFQIEFEATRDQAVALETTFVSLIVPAQGRLQDDPVSGVWEAEFFAEEIPEGQGKFTLHLKLESDGSVTGMAASQMGELDVEEGSFNRESGKMQLFLANEEGMDVEMNATIKGDKLQGKIEAGGGEFSVEFEGNRTSTSVPEQESAPRERAARPARRTERGSGQRSGRPAARRESAPQQSEEERAEAPTAADDDPVTGRWQGRFINGFGRGGGGGGEERARFTLILKKDSENKVTGSFDGFMFGGNISDGEYKPDDKSLFMVVETERFSLEFNGQVDNDSFNGSIAMFGREIDFETTRVSKTASAEEEQEEVASGDPLSELVPGPRWVSSLEASRYKAGRVYITLDGHRSNDDEPYVFVSENYGKTWTSLRGNLPTTAGSTRVIREDIENENLLFLGCEFSAWVSIDRGQSWTKFQGGLPTVAVHEIAIHPTSGEIVAGTHGRSLWVADITGLRKLTTDVLNQPAALLEPNHVVVWRRQPEQGSSGTRRFVGDNPDQNAKIYYHLKDRAQNVSLNIYDARGNLVRTLDAESGSGLHLVDWDLRRDSSGQAQQGRGNRFRRAPSLPAGDYLVSLTVNGQQYRQLLKVENDPTFQASATTEEEWEWMLLMAGEGEEEAFEIDR